MKTLANKINKLNIISKISMADMNAIRPRSVVFYAYEKNGKLSQKAETFLQWCIENGFEMVSRSVGKVKINNEYFEGTTQDVIYQLTSYTIK